MLIRVLFEYLKYQSRLDSDRINECIGFTFFGALTLLY